MITPQERTLAAIIGKYDPGTDTGYYGFVKSKDLINGIDLAVQLKFTSGFYQHKDSGWLKFYIGPDAACNDSGDYKIVYVAKRNLMYHVSWDEINECGLVDGSRCISIYGNMYRVRLLTGGIEEPGDDSEWNELMYRVYYGYTGQRPVWEMFTDHDLDADASGRYSWMQERINSSVVHRGERGIVYWQVSMSSYAGTNGGWRPVLELIN